MKMNLYLIRVSGFLDDLALPEILIEEYLLLPALELALGLRSQLLLLQREVQVQLPEHSGQQQSQVVAGHKDRRQKVTNRERAILFCYFY